MGTSIIVCGKEFDIGTKVVLWTDPNGLNAYDTTTYKHTEQNRKTGKEETITISGKRYRPRSLINPNPSFAKLQEMVTQFFLHHSGLYHSNTTFDVLHKERGLSVHFILDDSGTLFQTLDLKEKAQHGGQNNPISVGIEIDSKAEAGKYPNAYDESSQAKYKVGPRRKRNDIIRGMPLVGFEYNDAQYRTLIKLAIGICSIFPIVGTNADFPRGEDGKIFKDTLDDPLSHLGFICHFQTNRGKIDPISFDFDRFLDGVKTNNPDQPSSWDHEPIVISNNHDIIDVEPDVIVLENWRQIQSALLEVGYDPGIIDGIFGKNTRKALIDFQSNNELDADGIWGPKSKAKLEEVLRRKRNGE